MRSLAAAHRPAPEPVPARATPKAGEGHGRGPGGASASLAYSAGRGREPLPAFPHARAVERSTGREVRGAAVHDPEACARRGVPAFTDGGTSFFAHREPALRVAAHEAAHVLQHTGATRDAGLGAEGHAGAVSHAVEGGLSARGLVGEHGSAVPSGVRNYTEMPVASQKPGDWDAGVDLRVADNGFAAVSPGGGSGSHDFWAWEPLLVLANMVLKSVGSVIRLRKASGTLEGSSPDRTGLRKLVKVEPENVETATKGDSMELWADCGKAGRDVMGAGEGSGENYGDMKGVCTADYVPGWTDAAREWWDGTKPPATEEYSTSASGPEAMKNEIMVRLLGGTTAEAWAKYKAMTPAARDAFDAKAKINKYAAPRTGEGWTMSSGGNNYAGQRTWNFHWAGVVLTSGSDRVTLENYSVSRPMVQNTKWRFQMYGPPSKLGQTFHEQHLATKQHGDMPTTMTVMKR